MSLCTKCMCITKPKTKKPLNYIQATEKWSSVRLSGYSKNKLKFENHISAHSNVDLNGFVGAGGVGGGGGLGGGDEKLKQSSNNLGQEVCFIVQYFVALHLFKNNK